MPLISVIVPAYNRARLLPETIRSVLAQTFKDFELVIVDDGSTDDTAALVRSFMREDERIQYVHQENRGRSAARNLGISLAKGEYIAFLDSDDVFSPEKLALQIRAMQAQPEYGMSYTNYSMMNESGEPIRGWGNRREVMTGYVYPALLYSLGAALISTPGAMIQRSVLDNVGNFDETMHYCEDLDLWRRIARLSPILQIREPLVTIRKHVTGVTYRQIMRNRQRYLQKAFHDDPDLSSLQRRSLYRDMYLHYGYRALRRGEVIFFISTVFLFLFTLFKEPEF